MLLQDNRYSEAISVYKRLCKIEDDSLQTYSFMGLASAYLMSNQYQNAIENYNKSIGLNSNNAASYTGLGSAYFRLGDYRKAIESYNYSKRINPNSPDNYWGLAMSYDELKVKDSAKVNAKRFNEIEPHSKYRNLAEDILAK